MPELVLEIIHEAPLLLEILPGVGPRGPAGGGGGGGGGVSTETVQSMINAEVGPTAPDPTLIFDQYLI